MGLIREIQGVNATINKQERARREREQQKILEENYKKELNGNLRGEFSHLFEKLDFENAYKIAVQEKENIIEKINNIIRMIKHKENNETYYSYRHFDIITDLNENYYKIFEKVKKEVQLSEKIRKSELADALESKISRLFNLSNNKHCASIVAKKHDMIEKIINDVATNEPDRIYLKNNYSKILKKILFSYSGNIELEKMEIKNRKAKAKIKQERGFISQLIIGHILGDISKSLPKSFSKGKGR